MRGFEDALDELYQVAYRVAYRMLGSRSDSEDVAQEAVARAWIRWRRIEAYAPAWVARCAANLVLDRIRRSRRPLPPPAGEIRPDDPERVELVHALSSLPKRQREVVVMRYLADLSEADVAERLGCSVGAVKQHARRGLQALRKDVHLAAGEER